MAVMFPKINSMEIYGFQKIFINNNICIDFEKDLSILLGGNGLGKTTLLQCIIYALTGGSDNPEVEENKVYRWNQTYFKGRVDSDAYVSISFSLGEVGILVKRSFSSPRILECKASINEQSIEGFTYDELITQYGNYAKIEDFAFLINRLIYLPENRRSLLWDHDAQIRTLMIINNEFIVEDEYSSLRAKIKEKDSNRRKVHWDIGRIEKRRSKRKEKIEANIKKTDDDSEYITQKKRLLNKLQSANSIRSKLYDDILGDKEKINALARQIEQIGNQIDSAEADHLRVLLEEYDDKYSLVFNKTMKSGYCPACDQQSLSLQELVKERIQAKRCLVCGERLHNSISDNIVDVDGLSSQLDEKILARNELDVSITQNQNRLAYIEQEISTLREALNSLEYDYADTTNLEDEEDVDIDEALEIQDYEKLRQLEKELEIEIANLTKIADRLYEEFISNFQNRYSHLHEIYSVLASKFLGLPVDLKYAKSNAKFVSMKYLIPCFNDTNRESPDTCSEAQRFFLDIAFRMSLITLNKTISNNEATFICETPENALDVSYINNVVLMFMEFMSSGGKLILSSNLQLRGIAQFLLKKCKEQNIGVNIFDLLEHGRLSNIQSNSEVLKEIRDEILAEVHNE